jgi:hypothetical protein
MKAPLILNMQLPGLIASQEAIFDFFVCANFRKFLDTASMLPDAPRSCGIHQ